MSTDKPISYLPSEGWSYDPKDELYWDEDALNKEITRSFEVCHGCRMCFKYCDSFPSLFSFIDDRHDGDVRKITEEETKEVMDDCFQCKLCEVQCPYTPREEHEFMLDFPKLVHRYKAIEHKKTGGTKRDRFLADPDKGARLARRSLGLANIMNRVGVHRWFLEKTLGIHRKKLLPDFAFKTFDSWAKKEGLTASESPREAILFQTCYVQNNEPEIGRDTVFVLKQNQVDVGCVKDLACCGMPAWETGDLEGLRKNAHENLNKLMPHVEQGSDVLVINPTCSMMMRDEWPELLDGADRERALRLSEKIKSPSDLLWSLRKEERFNDDFKSTPGPVAYHTPCHLRAQAKGFKGRDMLRKIPGAKPTLVSECCGHDGTYAMKVESFEASARIGKKAFDGMIAPNAEVWATDCPLAALQFQQHAGVRPMHPMSILAKAYREDGFEKTIEKEGE
jgi:glycerol-3-phosphate dehydrogenase subunit C